MEDLPPLPAGGRVNTVIKHSENTTNREPSANALIKTKIHFIFLRFSCLAFDNSLMKYSLLESPFSPDGWYQSRPPWDSTFCRREKQGEWKESRDTGTGTDRDARAGVSLSVPFPLRHTRLFRRGPRGLVWAMGWRVVFLRFPRPCFPWIPCKQSPMEARGRGGIIQREGRGEANVCLVSGSRCFWSLRSEILS